MSGLEVFVRDENTGPGTDRYFIYVRKNAQSCFTNLRFSDRKTADRIVRAIQRELFELNIGDDDEEEEE